MLRKLRNDVRETLLLLSRCLLAALCSIEQSGVREMHAKNEVLNTLKRLVFAGLIRRRLQASECKICG